MTLQVQVVEALDRVQRVIRVGLEVGELDVDVKLGLHQLAALLGLGCAICLALHGLFCPVDGLVGDGGGSGGRSGSGSCREASE